MKEPYIDEELIRIQIEVYGIYFIFTETILQIGANFLIAAEGRVVAEINPAEQKGDLVVLWPLIGQTVKGAKWGEEVKLIFANGTEIKIPSVTGYIRGSIVGRQKIDSNIIWEDF